MELAHIEASGNVKTADACMMIIFPYLQCFSSNLLLLLRLHAAQSAHVVQPICQLDHNDPYFFSHGQKELPEVLRLDICSRSHARDLADLAEACFALNYSPHC